MKRVVAQLISCLVAVHSVTAPDGSTSGDVGFLQSWKEIAVENYVAPTMCYILHATIF